MTTPPRLVPRHAALRIHEFPGKGRGVVAGHDIGAGELLEAAPAIPLKPEDVRDRTSTLFDYPFSWDDPPYVEAIACGVVSMLNHSETPNASFEAEIADGMVRVWAARDIAAGEEITINYGIPLWFEAAK